MPILWKKWTGGIILFTCYFSHDQGQAVKVTHKWSEIKQVILDTGAVSYLHVHKPSEMELRNLTELLQIHDFTVQNFSSAKFNALLEQSPICMAAVLYDIRLKQHELPEVIPVTVILAQNAGVVVTQKRSDSLVDFSSLISNEPGSLFHSTTNLFNGMLDHLMDTHFALLADYENKLENLEESILETHSPTANQSIHALRKGILKLRKTFLTEQEILYKMSEATADLLSQLAKQHLQNMYYHFVRMNTTLDEYRVWSTSLLEAYSSNESSRLNDIVQRLTLISFIFMPLTFLSGWYGMNFKNMPELNLDNGYFYFVGIVVVMVIALLIYFKRKKWL